MDPPSVSPAALLCRIETLLVRSTGATSVRAFLVNRRFNKLFHFSEADPSSGGGQQQEHDNVYDTRAVCEVGEGVAGVAALTGRKLLVKDVSMQERSALCCVNQGRGSLVCWPVLERLSPSAPPEDPQLEVVEGDVAAMADDVCALAGSPPGTVHAVLQVYCADGQLSAEATEVLRDVGRLLVPLLADSLLLAEEHMRRRTAEALYSLSEIVPREMGLIAMVEKVVTVAEHMMDAERVCLFFVDDVADELWVAKSVDFDDAKIKIGCGLCGHAAATGETVNVIDCYEDSRFDSRWDKQTGFVTKRCAGAWVLQW